MYGLLRLFFTGTLPHSTTDLFIRPIIIPLSRAPPSKNSTIFRQCGQLLLTENQSPKSTMEIAVVI